jgi:hypothetical protein
MTYPSGLTAEFGYGEGGARMPVVCRRVSRREARRLAGGQARPGRAGRRHRKAVGINKWFSVSPPRPRGGAGRTPQISKSPESLKSPKSPTCLSLFRPARRRSVRDTATAWTWGGHAVSAPIIRWDCSLRRLRGAAERRREFFCRGVPVAAAGPAGPGLATGLFPDLPPGCPGRPAGTTSMPRIARNDFGVSRKRPLRDDAEAT